MAKANWRAQAEKLADIYVTWKMTTDTEAGWHSGSIIGRLVDFRGDLPASSGFYGVDRMEKEVRYLVNHHADLPAAKAALSRLDKRYYDAVVSDQAFRGRTKVAIDPFRPEKPVEIRCTDEYIARVLEITVRTYRDRITEGYRQIADYCGWLQAAA